MQTTRSSLQVFELTSMKDLPLEPIRDLWELGRPYESCNVGLLRRGGHGNWHAKYPPGILNIYFLRYAGRIAVAEDLSLPVILRDLHL